ncbi:MAG: M36 family metallopeptidase [Myxococcales bacterium]|nr:MAG: M36 family metallopeptidase [Myxococcales bacterium]
MLLSSSLSNPSDSELNFISKKTNIAGQEVQRLTPIINGIIVEGADSIYNKYSPNSSFEYTHFSLPKVQFQLSPAECLEIAIKAQPYSLIKNPYTEKINGTFEAVWLMHFDSLRPVYKTRLPTLSLADLKDIYVDAQSGEILKIDESAYFDEAYAKVFTYSPSTNGVNESDLKEVKLKDLVNVRENSFLEGEYMQVRTCCKYFTCPNDGPCSDEEKRCALSSHPGARQTREIIQLPTDSLGLDPLMSLPPKISVDTVRCTYLPFAKASPKNSNGSALAFYATPIDEPGPASEMDSFSEIQAYFSMSSFFQNIRSLLEDQTWCLRSTAMSCDEDGKPKMENNKPVNPYRIFVNQLIPDMKLGNDQSDPNNFIVQILAGKGSKENPVVLKQFTRMGNAAFVPALSQLKTNTPRADEILSDLIKPYDHNVFFQGDRDFAYDGDVVFHEFMHAITTSLVNKLNSMGLNRWGIHFEPGSLNEGWSDYFAAAFTNDPSIGEYAAIRGGSGEASLRNIDNDATCPESVIGEIHNDSQVWSGALWAIRKQITQQKGAAEALEFDRAVLTALSQATVKEDFETQSQKLLAAIRKRAALGEGIAQLAEEILEKRGVSNCFRAYPLSFVDEKNHLTTRSKNTLFIPSKNQIGLKNFAPSSSQLEIAIPAGAKKLTLQWKQFLGGTGALLGTESTPSSTANIIPISMIASFDTPITWQFKKAYSLPYRYGEIISDDQYEATYENGVWQITLPLDFKRCEQKLLYVSLLSHDFKYILTNLGVEFQTDNQTSRSDCQFELTKDMPRIPSAMNCETIQPDFFYFLFCLITWMRLRRKS